MKFTQYPVLLACGLALLCLAKSHSEEHWSLREQETVSKTLTLSGAPMRLLIDNIDGYVHVTGIGGSEVRVTAHKVIRAETDSDLQEAKSEVKLDMTEKPGSVSIRYDAPWRCNGGGDGGCSGGGRRRFYNVSYDIDVAAPRDSRLVVLSINGDVRADRTAGDFDVSNINGGIKLSEMSGSGDAHTINGPVSVGFAANPLRPSSFKSINGSLDLYFQPRLSADLLFKTFNGQIYSDFEVTATATPPIDAGQEGGRFVYHSRGPRRARVGNGGPELSFDTLNGNVRLHQGGEGVASR